MKTNLQNWSISDIWNTKVSIQQRPAKKRDYINASDMGGAYLDRYLKMAGTEPSNAYDERVLRIFNAGNIFEWIILKVFREAGILQSSQDWLEVPATKEHLKVIGRPDAIVGGLPSWDTARENIMKEDFPDWLKEMSVKFIAELEKKYPKGLRPVIAEIKSVNSMAFWAHKNRDESGVFKGYPHHKLQLLTYLLAHPEIKQGKLFYISKDDLCLQETDVNITEDLLKIWNEDVKQMTKYYLTKTKPPKEEDVVFNEQKGKWEENWKMGRSNYLTLITGLKKEVWEEKAHQLVLAKNKEMRAKAKEEKIRLSVSETGMQGPTS